MIVATAGHIDHGKTSLVKALTGIDTDRLPEEKRRGISIDLGFAYVYTPAGKQIAFVDVPGHERFVRNMLSGVTGAALVLLVVAADDGPMPQTLEHLAITALLTVPIGAVVITKCDRADRERVEAVADQTRAALAAVGVEAGKVFRVSSVSGEGLGPLRKYLDELADAWPSSEDQSASMRMAVDRVIAIPGHGTVLTGSVFAGSVAAGDPLMLTPTGKPVRLRSIQVAGQPTTLVRAGERCALNVAGPGVAREDVRRGEWIVDSRLHRPTSRIDARVRILATAQSELAHGTSVRFHHGTAAVTARVLTPGGAPVLPGRSAICRLVLNAAAGILAGDKFVLRNAEATRTLGGGEVVDPFAKPSRDARSRDRVAALTLAHPEAVLRALADDPRGADLNEFEVSFNVRPEAARCLYQGLDLLILVSGDERIALSKATAAGLRDAILAALDLEHARDPMTLGIPFATLRRSLGIALPGAIFAELLRWLAADEQLELLHSRVRHAGAGVDFSGDEEELWRRVVEVLDSSDRSLPRLKDLCAALQCDEAELQVLLLRKARRGLLLRVHDRLFLLPKTVVALAASASELATASDRATISVAGFRDRTGLNRHRSVQLLEYFDRIRYTRRVGEERRILRPFAELAGPLPPSSGD